MPTVYYVPGFLGSKIGTPARRAGLHILQGREIWQSNWELLHRNIGLLALPTRPDMRDIGLFDAGNAMVQALQERLEGWRVFANPWDFRFSLRQAAANLAARVLSDVSGETAFHVVGHSAGGLVARLAHRALRLAGHGGFASVVTLGTPHLGSYSPWESLAEADDTLQSVALALAGAGFSTAGLFGYGSMAGALYDILRVFGTWFTPFELVPQPALLALMEGSPSSGCYLQRAWRFAKPPLSQDQIDRRLPVLADLGDTANAIPADRMLTISGIGHFTASKAVRVQPDGDYPGSASENPLRIERSQRLRFLPAFEYSDGDGEVLPQSANPPGYAFLRVQAQHSALLLSDYVRDAAAFFLLNGSHPDANNPQAPDIAPIPTPLPTPPVPPIVAGMPVGGPLTSGFLNFPGAVLAGFPAGASRPVQAAPPGTAPAPPAVAATGVPARVRSPGGRIAARGRRR